MAIQNANGPGNDIAMTLHMQTDIRLTTESNTSQHAHLIHFFYPKKAPASTPQHCRAGALLTFGLEENLLVFPGVSMPEGGGGSSTSRVIKQGQGPELQG